MGAVDFPLLWNKPTKHNGLPLVQCPHCGKTQFKEYDKHHVYLCKCGVEFFLGYDGFMKYVQTIDESSVLDGYSYEED